MNTDNTDSNWLDSFSVPLWLKSLDYKAWRQDKSPRGRGNRAARRAIATSRGCEHLDFESEDIYTDRPEVLSRGAALLGIDECVKLNRITTDHSASSYGQPVLVVRGQAYGPGDAVHGYRSARDFIRVLVEHGQMPLRPEVRRFLGEIQK